MSLGFMQFTVGEPPPIEDGRILWAVGVARWARVAGPLVKTALRAKAPTGQGNAGSGRKPGTFRDSFSYRSKSASGSLLITFRSSDPVAPFVINGTRPHMIVPRNAKVLHFRTDAGGSVFAARVNHPGTRANFFASRAIMPLLPELQSSFSLIMRETFGGTS